MRTRKWLRLAATLFVAGLVAMSCGSDDDSSSGSNDTSGASSTTAPDDDAAAPAVDPACAPLAETATIKVSVSSPNMAFAPVYLGRLLGEFEAENLEVELVALTATEALAPLAQGDLDLIYSTLSAGQLNAIASGIDMAWVAPLYASNPETPEGLYARADMFDADGNFDWSQMRGKKMATQTGFGSVLSSMLAEQVFAAGLTFDDFSYESLGTNDILLALENGAIDVGWLSDPVWLQVQDNPDLKWVFGFPDPNGTAILAGPNFNSRPDVARAYFRALSRTIASYLQPDSIGSAETREALSEALEIPVDELPEDHARIFDPELSLDGADQLLLDMQEQFFIIGDLLQFDEPLPASQVINQTHVREALACLD